MSTEPDSHWHATSYRLMVGVVPATFFLPVPVLFFFHPVWFIVASLIWMVLMVWLGRKGLGIKGLVPIARRWLQGRRLPPRH